MRTRRLLRLAFLAAALGAGLFLLRTPAAAETEKQLLPLHNFDLGLGFSEIDRIRSPKGGGLGLSIRDGALAAMDLEPYPLDIKAQVASGWRGELSQQGGNGRIVVTGVERYPTGAYVEHHLELEAYCAGGHFTAHAREVSKHYSESGGARHLVETTISEHNWSGRLLFWLEYGPGPQTAVRRARYANRHYRIIGTRRLHRYALRREEDREGRTIVVRREGISDEYKWSATVTPVGHRADERGRWFLGRYLVAYGDAKEELIPTLQRLERFFAAATDSVEQGKLALAERQIDQLAGMLAQVDAELAAGGDDSSVRVVALPTSRALDKLRGLQTLHLRLRRLRLQAVENVDRLARDIQKIRLRFLSNVMKGMFRSYLSWSGSLPTDPVDGLGGFSLRTSLFLLPRNLKGILEGAQKDSGVLRSQAEAVRTMVELQRFWEGVRDNATAECKRLVEHLRDGDAEALLELHRRTAGRFRQDLPARPEEERPESTMPSGW